MNITNFSIDLSDTAAGHAYEGHQYEVLTTQEILELCGAMDANALFAGGAGIFLSLVTLFYLRRWRHKIKPDGRNFIDKGLLTMIAMLFVIMIVRIARAG